MKATRQEVTAHILTETLQDVLNPENAKTTTDLMRQQRIIAVFHQLAENDKIRIPELIDIASIILQAYSIGRTQP